MESTFSFMYARDHYIYTTMHVSAFDRNYCLHQYLKNSVDGISVVNNYSGDTLITVYDFP